MNYSAIHAIRASQMTFTAAHRYVELDSLRGLAALTVVLHHFLVVFAGSRWFGVVYSSPLHIFVAGHEAVMLFFLLSGFVLAIPYARRNPPTYSAFLAKRICRIYLPYVAALALAVTGAYFLHSSIPAGNPWIDQTWSRNPSRRLIVYHVLMIGNYDHVQFNTAFWSLIYEMRISLVYPLLYWAAYRVRTVLLLSASFAATLVLAVSVAPKHGDICYTLLYASFFLVGIKLQKHLLDISAWLRGKTDLWRTSVAVLAVLCFDGSALVSSPMLRHIPLLREYLQAWTTLIGAVGILVFAIDLRPFRQFLHTAPVVRLGHISYSVYLLHATVLWILLRLFGRPHFVRLLPVYLIATYLASEAFYALVEKPSIFLGRTLGKVLQTRSIRSADEVAR